jgi:hypothetical protein
VGEIWFLHEEPAQRVDILRYLHQADPIDSPPCRVSYSLTNRLGDGEEALLTAFKKDCRYEIRRAMQGNVAYLQTGRAGVGELRDFLEAYDHFAQSRGLAPADRPRLFGLAETGMLALSQAYHETHGPLVWHAYCRAGSAMILLHSVPTHGPKADSRVGQLVGRANRLLHFRDMVTFEAEGITTYDWGGWYEGDSDQAKLRINQFKEEFGGEVVRRYTCEAPMTLLGRVVLRLWRGGTQDAAPRDDDPAKNVEGSPPRGPRSHSARRS